MDAQAPIKGRELSATAIFAGSFICFGLILLLGLLSGAIGLTGSDFNWALFLPVVVLVVIIPFYGAGWAAARAVSGASKYLHAFTIWAIVVTTIGFVVGTRATDFGGEVLKQLGIAAGAKVGGRAFVEQLSELRPRLETKLNLKDGKAVTAFVFDGKAGPLTNELKQAARDEAEEITSGSTSSAAENENLARDLKAAARTTTWATFAALIVALGSTLMCARRVKARKIR